MNVCVCVWLLCCVNVCVYVCVQLCVCVLCAPPLCSSVPVRCVSLRSRSVPCEHRNNTHTHTHNTTPHLSCELHHHLTFENIEFALRTLCVGVSTQHKKTPHTAHNNNNTNTTTTQQHQTQHTHNNTTNNNPEPLSVCLRCHSKNSLPSCNVASYSRSAAACSCCFLRTSCGHMSAMRAMCVCVCVCLCV